MSRQRTRGPASAMLGVAVRLEGPLAERVELERPLREAMREALRAIGTQARLNLAGRLVRVRTGRLLASITERLLPAPQPSVARGSVFPRRFTGRFLETGAVRHLIPHRRRRRGRQAEPILAIPLPGGLVFRRRVQHPGVRGRAWLRQAAEAALPDIERAFGRVAERALHG